MLGLEKFVENSEFQYKYLIKLAMDQKVSWTAMRTFIHELANDFESAMKLNEVLLEELQSLVSKMTENKTQEIFDQTKVGMEERKSESHVEILFSKKKTIDEKSNFFGKNSKKKSYQEDLANESNSHLEPNDEELQFIQSKVNQIDNDDNAESIEDAGEFGNIMFDETQNLTNETTSPEIENETENNLYHINSSQEESEIGRIENKKESMKRRKVVINGERKYSCKTCGQIFTRSNNLKVHERIHTGEKPFKCKYCEKTLSQIQNLKQHERIHTGEKPFKCKYCHKEFNQFRTQKLHERIHTGEKFECEHCQKKYTTKQMLQMHERTHTGESPYKCKTCPKIFKSRQELQVHERIHTGEKPFKCVICDKSFTQSHSLKSHERIHSKQK